MICPAHEDGEDDGGCPDCWAPSQNGRTEQMDVERRRECRIEDLRTSVGKRKKRQSGTHASHRWSIADIPHTFYRSLRRLWPELSILICAADFFPTAHEIGGWLGRGPLRACPVTTDRDGTGPVSVRFDPQPEPDRTVPVRSDRTGGPYLKVRVQDCQSADSRHCTAPTNPQRCQCAPSLTMWEAKWLYEALAIFPFIFAYRSSVT